MDEKKYVGIVRWLSNSKLKGVKMKRHSQNREIDMEPQAKHIRVDTSSLKRPNDFEPNDIRRKHMRATYNLNTVTSAKRQSGIDIKFQAKRIRLDAKGPLTVKTPNEFKNIGFNQRISVSARSKRIVERVQHVASNEKAPINDQWQPVVLLTKKNVTNQESFHETTDSIAQSMSEPFSDDSFLDPEFNPEAECGETDCSSSVEFLDNKPPDPDEHTAKRQSVSTTSEVAASTISTTVAMQDEANDNNNDIILVEPFSDEHTARRQSVSTASEVLKRIHKADSSIKNQKISERSGKAATLVSHNRQTCQQSDSEKSVSEPFSADSDSDPEFNISAECNETDDSLEFLSNDEDTAAMEPDVQPEMEPAIEQVIEPAESDMAAMEPDIEPVIEQVIEPAEADTAAMEPDIEPEIEPVIEQVIEPAESHGNHINGPGIYPSSSLTATSNKASNAISNVIIVDNRFKEVPSSKSGCKKYYCFYCKKEVCNFGRHLLAVHRSEGNIRCILDFPKGHPEREKRIAEIRNKGALEFNTLEQKEIHVKRRPTRDNKTANDYKTCSFCQQMYSKRSIRVHIKKCKNHVSEASHTKRTVMMNIHPTASKRLVHVLSQCREDGPLSLVVFDKLAVTYGNKLIIKYRNDRNNPMIRQKIRSIGMFIATFRKYNPNCNNLKDILDPANYDTIVKTVNEVSGFNEISGKYRAPSTAYNLGLQLKEIVSLLETECIKEKDQIKRDSVRDLMSLMANGFSTDINKTVIENQTEQSRQKTVKLPTKEDIQALRRFLEKGRKVAYDNLSNSFSTRSWKDLAGYTLISIQLFNRRRAGELERILIEDYKTTSFVSDDDEIFVGLPEAERTIAKKYARFYIRGKLNRKVSVILSQEIIKCIDLFLKYRTEYGVHESNPYVFGIPSKSNLSYLRACQLMRHYSTMCGAPNPETLRGTELRKQIATACSVFQLADPLIEDIANHLGHHLDIHKRIYRQSTAREVPAVAQILVKALGDENDREEDDIESTVANETLITDTSVNTVESNIDTINELEVNDNINVSMSTPIASTSHHNLSPVCDQKRSSDTNKRRSWTPEERHVVVQAFQHMIDDGIVPTYQECVELSSEHPCLQNRTPPQIKSFVAYATKRSKKTAFKRVTWTAIEVAVVQREFKKYLDTKTLPSLKLCENVINKNVELNSRTAVVLKAYVNNLNRKNK